MGPHSLLQWLLLRLLLLLGLLHVAPQVHEGLIARVRTLLLLLRFSVLLALVLLVSKQCRGIRQILGIRGLHSSGNSLHEGLLLLRWLLLQWLLLLLLLMLSLGSLQDLQLLDRVQWVDHCGGLLGLLAIGLVLLLLQAVGEVDERRGWHAVAPARR